MHCFLPLDNFLNLACLDTRNTCELFILRPRAYRASNDPSYKTKTLFFLNCTNTEDRVQGLANLKKSLFLLNFTRG